MLNIELFKNEIENIWQNEKYQNIPFLNRGYAIQSVIPFNSILFIGINPSFDEKKINILKVFSTMFIKAKYCIAILESLKTSQLKQTCNGHILICYF